MSVTIPTTLTPIIQKPHKCFILILFTVINKNQNKIMNTSQNKYREKQFGHPHLKSFFFLPKKSVAKFCHLINIYIALLIYFLLKRTSNLRSMKISWNNKFVTYLIHFRSNIITIPHSFTRLFPPLIKGTGKQLSVNPWKHMARNDSTF